MRPCPCPPSARTRTWRSRYRRDKLRHPSMFSSVSTAAGDQIPLIASSSSSSAILHPPTRCDWPTPPPLAPCNLLYYPPPPDDLRFVSPPLAWPVDGAGGRVGEMLFLPPDSSGGGDIGAEGGGYLGCTRGLSLTLAATSTGKLGSVPYAKLLSGGGGGESLQDVVGTTGEAAARLREGLLVPFSGYAAILRGSRFSGPAQQLLGDFCVAVMGGEFPKRGSVGVVSRVVSSTCGYRVMGAAKESESRKVNWSASTSSVHNSADTVGDQSNGGGSGGSKIHHLEFQQKKAKLEQMQEEVHRKYKQYRQQMQMVVSSFEPVAGLNSAAPYTSLALKAILKHFMSLKNAISDQLQHTNKVVGEELVSSLSSSRGENLPITSQLKYRDNSLGKQKSGQTTASFMEDNNPPVWKPQRGLPERAVLVLRAWLFEHFLHPYPTDSDKHMLATQTGLSRNQVSNWFINARVRLWKPMIEEIHMLETKETSGVDLNSAKVREDVSGANSNCEQRIQAQLDCVAERAQNPEPLHADKRSRAEESETVASMDDGLMNFATHHRHGMDKVSLTLGLRHGGGQQNPQQMTMGYFGTQQINVP